jgi:hypothetical protein
MIWEALVIAKQCSTQVAKAMAKTYSEKGGGSSQATIYP